MSDPQAPETEDSVGPSYEFGEADAATFAQLAKAMRIVGVALIVWAFFSLGATLRADLGALVRLLAFFVTGVWTLKAAGAFAAISRTEGSDIGHLMSAIRSVHNLFMVAAAIVVVVFGWIALALLLTLGFTLL